MPKNTIGSDDGFIPDSDDGFVPDAEPGMFQQAASAVPAAYESAKAQMPWFQRLGPMIEKAGGNIAELGGYAAGRTGHPGLAPVAGAVGGAVAISPDIANAYAGVRGLYESPSAVARGIRMTPKELGKVMKAGEETAGISSDLPIRSGLKPRFAAEVSDMAKVAGVPVESSVTPPVSYPKNTESLLNYMKQRIEVFGDKLSPQELAHYRKMFPEMFRKGEVMRGTPQYATASDLQRQTGDLYNKAIPGREDLNAAYRVSKTLHPDLSTPIKNFVQKYGKQVLRDAIAIGLGVGGVNALFRKK